MQESTGFGITSAYISVRVTTVYTLFLRILFGINNNNPGPG